MTESNFYLLRYDASAVEAAVASGANFEDEGGVEEAFEVSNSTRWHVPMLLDCIQSLYTV